MITHSAGQAVHERLRAVNIYLITDSRPNARPLEEFVARSIAGGVAMVQLRDKTLADRELLAAATSCAEVCRRNGALFIVNDRLDIALACGADGVHVGQEDMPAAAVRKVAGDEFIVGLSTHSVDQIVAAQDLAVDYIGVGPIHETPTKPGRPAVGLELVRYAASHSQLPFFAIGGLDAGNVAAVIAAGARGVSVLRCISHADDPEKAARDLLGQFPRRNESPR
ncbi:MAG: thiamine phosphate synthase [Candidatus Eremiobacteraeota bacterium]|nr:thiamine phosphate synthase [Candidatus Eremiobacteraeota bacterium]